MEQRRREMWAYYTESPEYKRKYGSLYHCFMHDYLRHDLSRLLERQFGMSLREPYVYTYNDRVVIDTKLQQPADITIGELLYEPRPLRWR